MDLNNNRIAMIHPHLVGRGGSQRYFLEIANQLINRGICVDLFTYVFDKSSCYPELSRNLNIQSYIYLSEGSEPFCLKKERNFILRKIIDIFALDYIYSAINMILKANKIKKIMLSNLPYQLIFAHEEPLGVWAAIAYKISVPCKIYWYCYDTIYKWWIDWAHDKNNFLREWLIINIYFTFDRYFVRKYVDLITVLDHGVFNRVRDLYNIDPLIRMGGIGSIHSNQGDDKYLRRKFNISNDVRIITSITRFDRHRRLEDIFALDLVLKNKNIDNYFIYINAQIGDLDYYNDCKNIYKFEDNISLHVDINRLESDAVLRDIYKSSDIFLFPNSNQTWGNAVLEAVSAGNIPIVSDECGISKLINKLYQNCVYKMGSIEELSNAVEYYLNRSNVESMKNIGPQYITDNLTWASLCDVYLNDFSGLLAR